MKKLMSMLVVTLLMVNLFHNYPVRAEEIGIGTGLRGEYYNNMDLTDHKFNRTDEVINFNWHKGSPHISIFPDSFSARWTGKIQPLYTENYTFYLTSDNGRRLWINGQLLIDEWVDDWDVTHETTIQLEAGKKYDIMIEYFENYGGANIQLEWSSPSQVREIVPKSQLYLNESDYDFSWIKGAVFVPTNAVNQIQQWDEYDPQLNDRELYLASVYGINCVRIYLHFLNWKKDKDALLNNLEDFLTRADKYGIKAEIIFFDDCWNENPKIKGLPQSPNYPQSEFGITEYPSPIFGVHNSRWVECPGNYIAKRYDIYKNELKQYVQDVVNAHKNDSRIAFWEPYNEPGNGELLGLKNITNKIMEESRTWIKHTGTLIPITNCDFAGTKGPGTSDFYAFHDYTSSYGGPRGSKVVNTECMNRLNQTVSGVVNNYYNQNTGMIMWEAGIGRDNCRFYWSDTESNPAQTEPTAPFHGIFYPDGHPWSIIDVQALRGDDLSTAPVFNVEYYNDTTFTNLKKGSITPLIDFDLNDEEGYGSPDASAGIGKDNFSIRWIGKVKPPATDTYEFYLDSDNLAKVWIDDNLIIDKTTKGRTEVSGTVDLTSEQLYDIKVEYIHYTGNPSMHVKWSSQNLIKQPLIGYRENFIQNYSDNFDDGNSDGWITFGGDWTVADMKYTVANSDIDMKTIVANSHYTDFTYETDVVVNRDDTWSDSGLIFRANDVTNNLDGYRGYYAGISADRNKVILGKCDNKWIEIDAKNMTINKGETYHLKVEVIGNNIKVYINNVLKISTSDTTFVSGHIGLRSFKTQAIFDNVNVTTH